MGGCYQETIIKCKKEDLPRLFQNFRNEEAYRRGHGGYTGTFAEKDSICIIPSKNAEFWHEEEARERGLYDNDKYGPASAYLIAKDTWYIGGWCSS